MRFIIELPTKKVQEIQSLIGSGTYEDLQSFIMVAVENQLYIEKQPIENALHKAITMETTAKEEPRQPLSSSLLSMPAVDLTSMKTVSEPEPQSVSGEILWALYNRVFPVKVTLRALLNIIGSSGPEDGYVDLVTVQDAALEEAKRLGRILHQVDKKKHRIHGEKLSTGLPRIGDKAGERFKVHFVGWINSKSRLEGAPAILRFVNIKKDEDGRAQIGITKSGLQFASLENPVLDKADYTNVFSAEESDFYLRHISNKLAKEHTASIQMLKAIENGQTTPNELTQIVLEMNPSTGKEEAQAIRSSLISRLSELGMVTRKRTGLKVKYLLTKRGQEVITTSISKSD